MTSVQIRNVPDTVHQRLKVKAAQSGRSLNEYLLAQLEHVATRPELTDLAERIRARDSYEIPSRENVLEAIRDGRARR
jgi:plasmid stability protein